MKAYIELDSNVEHAFYWFSIKCVCVERTLSIYYYSFQVSPVINLGNATSYSDAFHVK